MKILMVGGSPEGSAEKVAELAASADRVLAVDSGASLCLAAGIKPDVVVGDLDSLGKSDLDGLKASGVEFEIHPEHKDVTDLDLALDVAARLSAEEVTATAVSGARTDHFLAGLGSFARWASLRPTVIEKDFSASILSVEARPSIEVTGEGSTFSVIALLGESTVDVTGARWPLVRASLAPLSSLGISNVVEGEYASVVVVGGVVAVIVPRVEGRQGRLRE